MRYGAVHYREGISEGISIEEHVQRNAMFMDMPYTKKITDMESHVQGILLQREGCP